MNAAENLFGKMRADLSFVAFSESSFIEVVEVETRLSGLEMNDEWEKIKCRHERVTFQKFGSEVEGDSCRSEIGSREGFLHFFNF